MNESSSNPEVVEIYDWAKSVNRFWFTVFHIITYFFTALADNSLKIISRAIVLIVPIPNAVSVFYLSQTHLGFGWWQALSMAFGIEIVAFFMIGISLYLLGGWLLYGSKWLIPLTLSIGATVAVIAVIVRYVYYLESISGGHTILAWLPTLSIGAFIALGVEQWHNRQAEVQRENRGAVGKGKNALGKRKNAFSPSKNALPNAFNGNGKTHFLPTKNAVANAAPSGETHSAQPENALPIELPEPAKRIFDWLTDNGGEHKVSTLATALELSKSTVSKYADFLVEQGLLTVSLVGNSYRYSVSVVEEIQ